MSDRIEKSIDLNAPVARVWRALTNHEEFGNWFRVKLDGPFVPGELSRGHITYPGYEHVVWEARVVSMEEPRLFSFTWHPYAIEPDVDYSAEQPTLVEFHLHPAGNGTHLSVVESGFGAIPAHRRAEAFRMNDDGWQGQMKNIKAHVDG
ncbi:SRPBCC family protein [Labrys neptuniae]